MQPIGKTPGLSGYESSGPGNGGLITPSEPSTPFENNLDEISVGFSYQGGLGTGPVTLSGAIA